MHVPGIYRIRMKYTRSGRPVAWAKTAGADGNILKYGIVDAGIVP